jgi:hypothetical protein
MLVSMEVTRYLILASFCFFVDGSAAVQIADASVCEILANPPSLDGKIVRVKRTVVAGFEEFVVRGSGCNQAVNAIGLLFNCTFRDGLLEGRGTRPSDIPRRHTYRRHTAQQRWHDFL